MSQDLAYAVYAVYAESGALPLFSALCVCCLCYKLSLDTDHPSRFLSTLGTRQAGTGSLYGPFLVYAESALICKYWGCDGLLIASGGRDL